MMCESFHRVNEQSESKGIGEGTGFIEFPVLLLLAVGEIDQAHYQSQQAEGVLIAKSHCQLPNERMILATEGPATADTATTIALIPKPRPKYFRG